MRISNNKRDSFDKGAKLQEYKVAGCKAIIFRVGFTQNELRDAQSLKHATTTEKIFLFQNYRREKATILTTREIFQNNDSQIIYKTSGYPLIVSTNQ
jgi:hypothetical protein